MARVLAGLHKLWRPDPTSRALRAVIGALGRRTTVNRAVSRALGIIELAVGVGVLASSEAGWTSGLAVLYASFACFVVVALATGAPLQSCGCFGATDRAPSAVHVALDAAVAALAVAVVTDASLGSPYDTLRAHRGLGAVLSLVLALALVAVLRRGRAAST